MFSYKLNIDVVSIVKREQPIKTRMWLIFLILFIDTSPIFGGVYQEGEEALTH